MDYKQHFPPNEALHNSSSKKKPKTYQSEGTTPVDLYDVCGFVFFLSTIFISNHKPIKAVSPGSS